MYYLKHTLAILCLTILLASCNDTTTPSITTPSDGAGDSTGAALADTIASKHFFYAWLADCVNDEAFLGKSHTHDKLLELANERIKGAIAHDTIKSYFGNHELVWGPALSVTEEEGVLPDYVSGNLIYCLKSTVNGVPHYSIGIAGTDMISPFDWLTEDLAVGEQVTWTPGGKISQGANVGFNVLNNFQANTGSITLIEYLNGEITDGNAVVSVSGHSLGGALTQVMASHLKASLTAEPTVQAWVYAGPTAGNGEFATTLVQNLGSNNYHAFNNSYDVVPHVWQADSLNKICDIYTSKSFCGTPFVDNPAVNGIVKYLSNLSAAGDYTIPGTPVTFVPPAGEITGSDCAKIGDVLDFFWEASITSRLYRYPNDIVYSCTGSDIIWEQFQGLYYFLGELGSQHTTGYTDHFLTDPGLANAVNSYVPGQTIKLYALLNADEGKEILATFLDNVSSNLPDGTDCACQPQTDL